MKLIESSVTLLQQEEGLRGIRKQIELAGRTCYKSEDKVTGNSAQIFVDRMIESGHTAMLEHGTVYLHFTWSGAVCQVCNQTLPSKVLDRYAMNPYSRVNYHGNDVYITTNMRVIEENGWMQDIENYLCEPTEYHERRISLKFVTDRGVSHELVRHRVFSFAQESTRYCNYSKDKFGNELTFIIPSWLDIPEGMAYWHDGICFRVGASDENPMGISVMPANFDDAEAISCYLHSLDSCNRTYMRLLKAWEEKKEDKRFRTGFKNNPLTPQQARQVLPNALKTEIVMTGFVSDWKHFFDLRLLGTTGKPHPDMLLLAQKAKKVLQDNDLWTLIYPDNEEVSNN